MHISLLIFLIFLNNVCGQAPWHTEQGGLARRGCSTAEGPVQQTLAWSSDLWSERTNYNRYYATPLIGIGNIAYIVQTEYANVNYGPSFSAVDIESGKMLWNHSYQSHSCRISVHPTLPIACAIYISTERTSTSTPFVECYDVSGKVSWNTPLLDLSWVANYPFISIEFTPNDSLLIGNQPSEITGEISTFISLSASNGTILWAATNLFGYSPYSVSFAMHHTNFYIVKIPSFPPTQPTYSCKLDMYYFDSTTPSSQYLWSFVPQLPNNSYSFPVRPLAVNDDLVLWGISPVWRGSTYVYGIDAKSGSMLWSIEISNNLESIMGMSVSPNNILVISTLRATSRYYTRLLAYDISNMQPIKLWEQNTTSLSNSFGGSIQYFAPSIDSNGIIYTCNGSVLGYNISTGNSVFNYYDKNYQYGCLLQPIIASGKILYSSHHAIVAVGPPYIVPPSSNSGDFLKTHWWIVALGGVSLILFVIGMVVARRRVREYQLAPKWDSSLAGKFAVGYISWLSE